MTTASRRDNYKISPYENVDSNFEFLNLSGKQLYVTGLLSVLSDLTDDKILKHLNISDNVSFEEGQKPSKMRALQAALRDALSQNTCLTALDLAGNHMFDCTMHPVNEHLSDYTHDLTDTLCMSRITHLDVSNNCIVGPTSRIHSGLAYLVRRYVLPKAVAFKCRDNMLNSQCLFTIAEGLGVYSSITELDLSNNYGGLDAQGMPNNEGTVVLARALSQTLQLRILRLARNSFRDDDIAAIAEAVGCIPTCQILDLSGNMCGVLGMRGLKIALDHHSTLSLENPRRGLMELNLSKNPIGGAGLDALLPCLGGNYSLKSLHLNDCNIDPDAMKRLQLTLVNNSAITHLDVSENPAPRLLEMLTMAEVEALHIVYSLRKNAMAVDTAKLTLVQYQAVARKLRFLTQGNLALLHDNPSFCVVGSEMRERLHMLCPEERHRRFERIKVKDVAIHKRLEYSREQDKVT